MNLTYAARYIKDEDTVLVRFPDVPGAHSFGSSREEAEKEGGDALVTMLAHYAINDEEFPEGKTKSDDTITVSILDTAKLLLLREVKRRGMTQQDLGEFLGYSNSSAQALAQRLMDFNHPSKIDDIERALILMGAPVALELVA